MKQAAFKCMIYLRALTVKNNIINIMELLEKIRESVDYIRSQVSSQPRTGIVLGSGLGNFAGEMSIEKEISYNNIPHFPVSTVQGHKGRLIFGELAEPVPSPRLVLNQLTDITMTEIPLAFA